MEKYKITFQVSEELLTRLKERGLYPFKYGGVEWTQGKSETVETLAPFYEGERAKKHVHDFLIVETLDNVSAATTKKAKHESPKESEAN